MKDKVFFSFLFSVFSLSLSAHYQDSYQSNYNQAQPQGNYGTSQGYYNTQNNPHQSPDSFGGQSQGNYYHQGQGMPGGYSNASQNPYAPKGYPNVDQGYQGQSRGTFNTSYEYSPEQDSRQEGNPSVKDSWGHQHNAQQKDHSYRSEKSDTRSYAEKYPKDTYATPSDLEINNRIRKQFSGWFTDSYKNVILHTSNGVVTVEGYVENDKDLGKLTEELRKIPGVRSVKNNAQVKR